MAPAPRFGTDGIRGSANDELTPEWAMAFGRVVAQVLVPPRTSGSPVPPGSGASRPPFTPTRRRSDTARDRVLAIGRDTRVSGAMLSSAFAAGVASAGVGVMDLGIMTTPGVAFISESRGVPAAVVSASHNPYSDNGVKLFAAGGAKLSDAQQVSIEDAMDAPAHAEPGSVGPVFEDGSCIYSYENHLVASLEGRRLDGLRVVVDCANGAASRIAPEVFRRLGADVVVVGDAPDGYNINDACGSTCPELLCAVVRERRADVGLAFDGDADRVIAADHTGSIVDGDHLLALFARDRHAQGKLAGPGVVVTVMTNLGFHLAMAEEGITVHGTDVGDRNVLATLDRTGTVLGGEQSGHIVFRDLATTGDGILSGILLLDVVARSGSPLAELAAASMTRLPQQLTSVVVSDTSLLDRAGSVWDEAARVEEELGEQGRVLIRASGTEPKIRVMVEAPTDEQAAGALDRLRNAVERAFETAG